MFLCQGKYTVYSLINNRMTGYFILQISNRISSLQKRFFAEEGAVHRLVAALEGGFGDETS